MSEHSRRIVILIVVAVVSLACLCICCGALGVGGLEMYSSRLLTGTPAVETPRPAGTHTPVAPPGVHRSAPTPVSTP